MICLCGHQSYSHHRIVDIRDGESDTRDVCRICMCSDYEGVTDAGSGGNGVVWSQVIAED